MNDEIGLKDVWSQFEDFQYVFLATMENNQPRVRPVTLIYFENRFWVTTDTWSAKVKQIQRNPKIEFSYIFKEGNKDCCLRVTGVAEIVKDREPKAKIANYFDAFTRHWDGVDDPDYTLLEIIPSAVTYVRPDKITHMKV